MKKVNTIVLTQNVILESLVLIRKNTANSYPFLFVSTHRLFENEIELIKTLFKCECLFRTFSDFVNDGEMARCDRESFDNSTTSVVDYYSKIKHMKNQVIASKIQQEFEIVSKIIVCDDLGIDLNVWLHSGFKFIKLKYYFNQSSSAISEKPKEGRVSKYFKRPIYTSKYDGKKYIFHGCMDRISYRFNIIFKRNKIENWLFFLMMAVNKVFKIKIYRKNVERITTIHESSKWYLPDYKKYSVGIIQDGYLPPNYESRYLKFYSPNKHFYAWDDLGKQMFLNQGIDVKILPFAKPLPIPYPVFKRTRVVLCVASGAGDWTALKNRSDEDDMIIAFTKVAKKFPSITFIYRCHPTWVHPEHQGVNSINRVAEYFEWLNLPNLVLSTNIPSLKVENFQLSLSRNSLEEDLEKADLVFGEHSISMIDAALLKIPFASVNVTGRRNFFEGITAFGFPHCESINEICEVIEKQNDSLFQNKYCSAVDRYNKMTRI